MIVRVMPLWRYWSESRFIPVPPDANDATRKLQVLELQMALGDAFGTRVAWPDQGDDVVNDRIVDADLKAFRELARDHGGHAKYPCIVTHVAPPNVFVPCTLREPVVGKRLTIGSGPHLLVELRAMTDLLGESSEGAAAPKDAASRLEAGVRARARRAWATLLDATIACDAKKLPIIFAPG